MNRELKIINWRFHKLLKPGSNGEKNRENGEIVTYKFWVKQWKSGECSFYKEK